MQSVHHLHPRLMGSTRPLRVLLVGAGGSGSAVLLQLPFLEQALRAWGQPGLAVTVMDPDTVSEVNVVRQPFSHVDIGSNKAMCLVGRINMFWGFAWKAIPHAFGEGPAAAPECDLLISCVDTRKARHQIAESFKKFRAPAYHLDLGNNASSGQYVLGQPRDRTVSARAQETRLPTVFELYPEIADITHRGKPASKLLGRGGAGPAGAVHQSDPGRQFARHACSIAAVRANLISRRLL